VVIPEYDEIDIDIIKSNMRTVGMSREEYFALLKKHSDVVCELVSCLLNSDSLRHALCSLRYADFADQTSIHLLLCSPFTILHLRNFFPSMWEKSANIGKHFTFFSGLE
jgi:hypothetical protein